MQNISVLSQIILYVLLGLIGLSTLLLWGCQAMVLRGKAFKNPDGSTDDWHEQKSFYGIAFADVWVSCPVTLIGIALVFIQPRWGHYLLAMTSFWCVWANVMTTATSIRFHQPKLNLPLWFVGYPLGALVGLAYIAWTVVHFDAIYFS